MSAPIFDWSPDLERSSWGRYGTNKAVPIRGERGQIGAKPATAQGPWVSGYVAEVSLRGSPSARVAKSRPLRYSGSCRQWTGAGASGCCNSIQRVAFRWLASSRWSPRVRGAWRSCSRSSFMGCTMRSDPCWASRPLAPEAARECSYLAPCCWRPGVDGRVGRRSRAASLRMGRTRRENISQVDRQKEPVLVLV